jgi:hypothetical protein
VAHGASAPPTIGFASRHGKSARLSDHRPNGPVRPGMVRQIPNQGVPRKGDGLSRPVTDPVAQRQFGLSQPEPLVQFEGASDDDNAAVTGFRTVPPDTEGDVGPDHYFQYINNVATIYDKTGGIVLGPFAGNAFWEGLGGPCEVQNDGDPLVRYDRQADRWVASQFALPNFPNGPFYQCIAVSTTNDPTGEYWQYEFLTNETFFTDYGKIGVWPDAYYMSFNMFGPNGEVEGGAYAFDRAAMLAGAPAGMIIFSTGNQVGVLPSDLDGATPPPAGSPNYFMTFDVNPARLLQWQFHVDWSTPANSTFTGPLEIPVAEFIFPVCEADRGQCVPQLDSPEKLETLDGRLMYRLVYRNFGDHESLVVNHTVGTETGSAALRWYEIRSPGASPVVHQQGTYAPDSSFRWMGSLAMDGNGNIALGYSRSSASEYPSVAVTGRLAGDPPGTMGAEDVWVAGGGSQIQSSSRWGDYSTMSIDPVDDCTFWYTQEYYAETASFDFKTRIGSMRFPSCTSGPAGVLEGTVTGESGPVAGATVTAAPAITALGGASTTTTDEAGHYQFLTLPAGSYDVTASRFGFLPSTVAGVAVGAGATTVQDFTLEGAPTVLVVGTVRDGSGHGWPLYASLAITGPAGYPGETLYSDPVTGYYSASLVAGATYEFAVTSLVPGYEPGGGPLTLAAPALSAPTATVANWSLAASPTCTAPGFGSGDFVGPLALSESFDAGVIPPGWSVVTTSGVSWNVYTAGDPCFNFEGNRTGGSGPYAIVNSGCESQFTTDDTYLVTAPIDLSGRTSATIQWANDYVIDEFLPSAVNVDVSADGGTSWTTVWQRGNSPLPGPGLQVADMSFAAGSANVVVRFHYLGFFSRWWQVDDVRVGQFACAVTPGGLVVGTVSDRNTGEGVTGATVENLSDGGSTTSYATPGSPGFYSIFADGGAKSLEASFPAYEPLTHQVTVVPNATTRLDFSLAAGILNAAPRPLQAFLAPGTAEDRTLTLSNSGTAGAGFLIQEVAVPPVSSSGFHGFADPRKLHDAQRRIPFERMDDLDQSDLPLPEGAPADAPAISGAGIVVDSFPTGLAAGFGIAYDSSVDRLWIANTYYPDFGFNGDGFAHQFTPDGTDTGETIDIQNTGGIWQAEGTYNGRTGMIWMVNVGSPPDFDNCLFEMDPVTKVVTGKKICGPWTSAQRAVAYDYATDTYYVGGPNDATIYHIDSDGNLLDSAFIGIAMTGLAYNPTTRHLFLMAEGANPWDVWVFEPASGYAVLGGFRVTSGGVPVLPPGETLGLEADCQGRLWVNTRFAQIVYRFESGETGWCVNEIPWLSETPAEGAVAPSSALPVAVTFDSQGLLPGLRQGSLIFTTDTPDPVAPVPVDLTVLFNDVPQGSFAWNSIYGAAGAGVMPGCAPQAPTFTFCPTEVVTRRSMAGFIERAIHGALTPPPVYLNGFEDVLAGSFNANYIQGLVDDEITAGCSVAPPLYCPDVPVTRAQMAVFVWKALYGDIPPPACTGVFDDVPCPGGFAVDYIEGIYSQGITVGCGNGDYCPDQSISNAQMAVFLVKAFELPYLVVP